MIFNAGIGAVVAVVLLPARTGVGVKRAATEVLLSVASFLEAAATLSSGEMLKRVREVDGKLRRLELRLAENARSVAASFSLAGAPVPEALDAALQAVRESLEQFQGREARNLPRVPPEAGIGVTVKPLGLPLRLRA